MPRKPKCNDDEVIKVTCVKRKKSGKRKYKKKSPCDKKIRPRPKSPGRRKKSKNQRSRARNKTAAADNAVVEQPAKNNILTKVNKISKVAAANKDQVAAKLATLGRQLETIEILLNTTPQEELENMLKDSISKPEILSSLEMLENVNRIIGDNPNGLIDMMSGAGNLLGGGDNSKLITNSAESADAKMPDFDGQLLNM